MSPDRRHGREDDDDLGDLGADDLGDLGGDDLDDLDDVERATGRTRAREDGFDDWGRPVRVRRSLSVRGRRLLVAVAIVLGTLAVLIGGSFLPIQQATTAVSAAPLVGRTSSVCPVAEVAGAAADDQPSATTTAVTIRQAPDREGTLTGGPLAGGDPLLEVKQQGFGAQIKTPSTPLLLQAVGVMSTASSGAVLASADSGELTGLSMAPCTSPSTSQWFVGVGGESSNRTELVLSNTDDAQAEVDLRFFGASGRIVVPGSPGLIVPAHDTRTVSLESLVNQAGPLTVWVRATTGRVSAMARDLHSVGLNPAGVDWHPASVSPRRSLVIPGVPEGAGARVLQVVNPDTTRAMVTISVLGATGAFAPAGADQLEVPPESTATISLDAGLAGQGSGIAVTADRPVSASVMSTSSRTDSGTGTTAQADIAIQPATAALGDHGVSPIAAVSGADGTLMLSNPTDVDTDVSFTVANLSGVTLRQDTMLIPAHGTSTRNLDSSAGESYLVVDLPEDSEIYGAVDFAQTDGPVAGLSSLPIMSPDLASRSRDAVSDPAAGR